jgi:predicted nicotinamide N-methyase
MGDPFGVVMWPGSILASMELLKHHYRCPQSRIENKTVLVLGAGTGVEAQVAGLLGARKVIATDINQMAMRLLKYAIDIRDNSSYSMSSIVECRCKLFIILFFIWWQFIYHFVTSDMQYHDDFDNQHWYMCRLRYILQGKASAL